MNKKFFDKKIEEVRENLINIDDIINIVKDSLKNNDYYSQEFVLSVTSEYITKIHEILEEMEYQVIICDNT